MPKNALRRNLLERRRSVSATERALMDLHAQKMCLECQEFVSARVVALYSPVHHEVETAQLFSEAIADGKVVLFPAVTSGVLDFRRVKEKAELVPGKYGILEPSPCCESFRPDFIDFLIIPGVAFDLCCRRIGYGKGYYDKALHGLEGKGRLAGFCYDFQIVGEIPAAPHDIEMDLVITDRRVISVSGQFT